MKNIIVYLFTGIVFVSCTKSTVKIEEVKIKPIDFKNICFRLEESSYPQISGLEDEMLQKEFNKILSDNYNNYIESEKKGSGCDGSELEDGSLNPDDLPSAWSRYKILCNDGNILSIVQYLDNCPGYGGNGCTFASKVVNFDIKNRKVLSNSDILKSSNMEIVNQQWHSYFIKMYPESAEYLNKYVSDPFSNNKLGYEKLNFGIRNDSVMLVVEAQPESHASYGTYVIPIEQWNK